MNGQRRPRPPVGSPGGALVMLLVMAGLFVMHGLQPAAGPADTHTAVTLMAMPGTDHPAIDASHHHAGRRPSHDTPRHGHHPGGQMCLGLLAVAVLLLLSGMLVRLVARTPAHGLPTRRGRRRQGRAPPPPSIFRLSVLRL